MHFMNQMLKIENYKNLIFMVLTLVARWKNDHPNLILSKYPDHDILFSLE